MLKEPNIADKRPNLYLLGFMGTGKSSVGRRVAAALGLDSVSYTHLALPTILRV